jgi:hypothetical protein
MMHGENTPLEKKEWRLEEVVANREETESQLCGRLAILRGEFREGQEANIKAWRNIVLGIAGRKEAE